MKLPFTLKINNKPNLFIEKIWQGLLTKGISNNDDFLHYHNLYKNKTSEDWVVNIPLKPKLHTIRRGQRWSVGMQIEFTIETLNDSFFNFAPETPCIGFQNIEISYYTTFQVTIDGNILDDKAIKKLAINDGFEDVNEFQEYFNTNFNGQIVHWTEFRY